MQKWQITFVDDHGVQSVEQFTCEQRPSLEDAAHMIRNKLVPVAAELDLNDLEGRQSDPTVKILKDQNSIQILDISPAV
ncbi:MULTISPECIES: hypothetical protein [Pseudomonas]|uniref:Uncharacterized protein n=1 Tax=Pseudomonas tritici TaxID=2745518 RepID=A0A8H9YLB0_9PSED|nr:MULTISPECIES: hypothetical protein [Pseudomonas]MBP2872956.1 hypothetical protein [Pseudomonas sp. SWRI144]MBW8128409.1 hypothetical protein [Pseudomonas sp. LAP_36]MBW8138035.1 hypothetical protein [Pseudomonas sp. PAMC 26818]QXH82687.1 hypothetical protein HU722_0022265 [Pseudomonas tritici]CRM07858.1 hypothetical protein [Pseudomonas sp. 58 R 12]